MCKIATWWDHYCLCKSDIFLQDLDKELINIYLFIHLFVYLFIYSFIYLLIYLFIYFVKQVHGQNDPTSTWSFYSGTPATISPANHHQR